MSSNHERPRMSYTIPYVIEDTGRGERAMDIYSRLLKDRIVFIGTEINDQIANTVIAQLLFLRAEDSKKDISIYINSPGGYINSGLAILDTMQYMSYEINTYCLGLAASMGALLLMAGTKGKRYALPHSRIMIHQPSGGTTGTASDIELQVEEMIALKKMCAQIISDLTGAPYDKVKDDSERDFYMDPEQAIKYGKHGIIDKIASRPHPETKPST